MTRGSWGRRISEDKHNKKSDDLLRKARLQRSWQKTVFNFSPYKATECIFATSKSIALPYPSIVPLWSHVYCSDSTERLAAGLAAGAAAMRKVRQVVMKYFRRRCIDRHCVSAGFGEREYRMGEGISE